MSAERNQRLAEAGGDWVHYAQQCTATMEGNALMALVEVVQQAATELCDAIEASSQVEVPDSLVDIVVPFDADELDAWGDRIVGDLGDAQASGPTNSPLFGRLAEQAHLLHTLAAIKRAEDS